MPNYDEIEQAVDMTDSLRTIDDVEDVSMEVQVLKLLKDLKKEISYGKSLFDKLLKILQLAEEIIDSCKEILFPFRTPRLNGIRDQGFHRLVSLYCKRALEVYSENISLSLVVMLLSFR
uniref:Uncharacterized protein n=1 Tax=Rhizophagus irregularis (strain DAOM 181602 / DAOM 197198 / MUCL 43194) TaxID=747089 RepID=U9SQ74_RHIID